MQQPCVDSEALRAGSRLVWALIAGMAAAAAVACSAAHLSITWQTFPTIPAVITACAAITLFYRLFRPDPGIVYAVELITQILLIIFLGELLAYGAAASSLPYRDAELLAADRWLGFRLQDYLGLVNARPWLAMLSVIVYMTMLWQAPIVFAVLTLTRRTERLQHFAVALAVSLGITIAIFALFPALGWYGYLRINPAAFPNLAFFSNFVSHLEDVRSGALRAIPLDDIRGIISFPSYHAAAALLAVWAIWPLRFVRWPVLLLNALMVASTPIEAPTTLWTSSAASLSVTARYWQRSGRGTRSAAAARRRPVSSRLRRAWTAARRNWCRTEYSPWARAFDLTAGL
jgi:PAP2 superfamily